MRRRWRVGSPTYTAIASRGGRERKPGGKCRHFSRTGQEWPRSESGNGNAELPVYPAFLSSATPPNRGTVRGMGDVVIVGAGPAGLAVAAELRRRGIAATVLERGARVGEAWRGRYDRLHLHTIRWPSQLPGYRIPRIPWDEHAARKG
jgi:NADPH-dependent 2,4-dienoyl-CoA reductase/sulfur reductase-like enzyme